MTEVIGWEVKGIEVKLKKIRGEKYQIRIAGTLAKQELGALDMVKEGIVNKIDELESEEADYRSMG